VAQLLVIKDFGEPTTFFMPRPELQPMTEWQNDRVAEKARQIQLPQVNPCWWSKSDKAKT